MLLLANNLKLCTIFKTSYCCFILDYIVFKIKLHLLTSINQSYEKKICTYFKFRKTQKWVN